MFTMNDDLSIYATRGDIVFFSVTADDNGILYKFQPGDIVRMAIYGKKDAENCVMQKDFAVSEVTEKVFIYLNEEDTKIGESISKHKDYWYEIVLNPDDMPQTIIGYDEDGPKVFRLFPEATEIDDNYNPQPEDFPVVDEKLDMTSPRPVANKAIARAVATILDTCERTNNAVTNLYVTPEMFGAVGDGVTDDTEAFVFALESGRKVRVSAGKYAVSSFIIPEGAVLEFEGYVHNTLAEGKNEDDYANTNAVLILNGTIDLMPHVSLIGGVIFTKGTAFRINVADYAHQGINLDGVTVIGDGSENAIGVLIDASDNDTSKSGYLTLSDFNMLISRCKYGYRIYRPQTSGRHPWITFVNFKGKLNECYQGVSTDYGSIAHANGSGVYELTCCGGSVYKNENDAYIDISGDMPVVNCLFSDIGSGHAIKFGFDLTGTIKPTVHNYQQGNALFKTLAYSGERFVAGGMLVELTNSAMPNGKVLAVRNGGSIMYTFTGTFSKGSAVNFGEKSPYTRATVDTIYTDEKTGLLIRLPGNNSTILVSNETGADITLSAPIVLTVPHYTIN